MGILQKAARGAAWNIIGSLGARGLGLVSTFVVARYLSPAEYGEVGIAAVLVLTADQFTQFGLMNYIVAKPTCGRQAVFHAAFYHLVLGLLGLCALLLMRAGLSQLCHSPESARYIPGLVLAAVFERIGVLPSRILIRDLRFGVVAFTRALSELAFVAVCITLVVLGWGGQSIVVANIVQWFLFMVILTAVTDRREWMEPCRLTWEQTRKLFAFGIPMGLETLGDSASKNWDKLLVARFFGTRTVGAYKLASQLAELPATHVGEQIADVLLPSYAHMPPERRAESLVYSIKLLALIIFPLAIGLGSVSGTVTTTFFTSSWSAVAPMLAILAIFSVARPIGSTIAIYLIAIDHPTATMFLELGKLIAMVAGVTALSTVGPLWACVGVGVAFLAHTFAAAFVFKHFEKVGVLGSLGGLLLLLIATTPMIGAVLLAHHGIGQLGWGGGALALIIEVTVGGLVYVPSALLLAPKVSRELLRVARKSFLHRETEEPRDAP